MSTRLTGQVFPLSVAAGSGLWRRRSQGSRVGEAQLAVALSASEHPLVIVDAFDRIELASTGAQRLLCSGAERLHAGSSIWSHVAPTDPSTAQTIFRQALAGKDVLELVLENQHKRRATLALLRDLHGEATHVSIAFEAPQESAEAALGTVGRLAGALAHDINNQLAAAMNNLYILKRRLQHTDPVAVHLHDLQSAMWRAAAFAGTLMHIARRHALQAAPSSLNDTITELAPLLRHLSNGFALQFQLEHDLPDLRAPLTELEQIITSVVLFSQSRASAGSNLVLKTSMHEIQNGLAYVRAVRLSCEVVPRESTRSSSASPASRRLHGVVRRALKRCHARVGHDQRRVWVDFVAIER